MYVGVLFVMAAAGFVFVFIAAAAVGGVIFFSFFFLFLGKIFSTVTTVFCVCGQK